MNAGTLSERTIRTCLIKKLSFLVYLRWHLLQTNCRNFSVGLPLCPIKSQRKKSEKIQNSVTELITFVYSFSNNIFVNYCVSKREAKWKFKIVACVHFARAISVWTGKRNRHDTKPIEMWENDCTLLEYAVSDWPLKHNDDNN